MNLHFLQSMMEMKESEINCQHHSQINLDKKFEIKKVLDSYLILITISPLHALASYPNPQAFLLHPFYFSLND